jgi:hypothetical protein
MARAQQGAEQLLSAAGLGEARANEVADEIVKHAETQATSARVAETPEPESAPESPSLKAAPEASQETPEPEEPAVEPEAGETPPDSPETEDSR